MTTASSPRVPRIPGSFIAPAIAAAALAACGGTSPPSRPGDPAEAWVSDPGYRVTVFASNQGTRG